MELVWRSRLSVMKIVFLLNRYLPIANIAFFIQCTFEMAVTPFTATVGLTF